MRSPLILALLTVSGWTSAIAFADETSPMPPLKSLQPEQYADDASALRTAEELEKPTPPSTAPKR